MKYEYMDSPIYRMYTLQLVTFKPLNLTTQYQHFTRLKRTFKNIVGKGENGGNQHFLLHNVFYPITAKLHHLTNYEIVVCKCFQFLKRQIFFSVVKRFKATPSLSNDRSDVFENIIGKRISA